MMLHQFANCSIIELCCAHYVPYSDIRMSLSSAMGMLIYPTVDTPFYSSRLFMGIEMWVFIDYRIECEIMEV